MGWAKTPKWGEALGENTVNEFRSQIEEWFEVGSKNPAKKISACQMQRLLQGMHPNRYDMPTEKQINQVMSSLFDEEKKKKLEAAATARALQAEKRKGKEK